MGRLIDEDYVFNILQKYYSKKEIEMIKKEIYDTIPTGFNEVEVIQIIEKNGYSWNKNVAPVSIQVDLVKAIIIANIRRRKDE